MNISSTTLLTETNMQMKWRVRQELKLAAGSQIVFSLPLSCIAAKHDKRFVY